MALIIGNYKDFRSIVPEIVDQVQICISYYKSQYHTVNIYSSLLILFFSINRHPPTHTPSPAMD